MRWWSLLVFALCFGFGWGDTARKCDIEMVLPEILGPPEDDHFTVSVIPYDASGVNDRLRLCYVPAGANFDNLGLRFNSPPTGVTCDTAVSSWSALGRVDFRTTAVLTDNTVYGYVIQCSRNAGTTWESRAIYNTRTLVTAGQTDTFTVTVESDTHFGQLMSQNVANQGGMDGGITFIARPGGTHNNDTPNDEYGNGLENVNEYISTIVETPSSLHLNLGDWFIASQLPQSIQSIDVPGSLVISPTRRAAGFTGQDLVDIISPGSIDFYVIAKDGEEFTQVHGYPTRTAGQTGDSMRSQRADVDPNVLAQAKFNIWMAYRYWQAILSTRGQLLSWGNHDMAHRGACGDGPNGGDTAYCDDGQGVPVSQMTHMTNAWHNLVVNPAGATYYPLTGTPTPSSDGQYYAISTGTALFIVLNPYEGTGGGGTRTNEPYDLSGQFPEHANEWSLGQAQFNWFNATLAASTAKWIFVTMHNLPGGWTPIQASYVCWNPTADTTSCFWLANATDRWLGTHASWYARGSLLATDRYCDLDLDGTLDVGVEDNVGVGGAKRCVVDDVNYVDGYSEEALRVDQPAFSDHIIPVSGWHDTDGACPSGMQCLGVGGITPYQNRTGPLSGHPSYGAPAVYAALKARVAAIGSGGSAFILLGHDHLWAAGCKEDSTGCEEVHFLTMGQTSWGGALGSGYTSPPSFVGSNTTGGVWSAYYDFNGDGTADYRTDGTPFPVITDADTDSINRHGSQQRGFTTITVSDVGVQFDLISSNRRPEGPGFSVRDTWVAYKIGEQAGHETDFDGANAADSESKRSGTAPVNSGFNCDDTTTVLEGSQSCSATGTATITATSVIGAATFSCADFLWRPSSDGDAGTPTTPMTLRSATTTRAAFQINPTGGAGDGQYRISSPTTSAWVDYDNGHTYAVRLCYDGAGDDAELWVEDCGTAADSCKDLPEKVFGTGSHGNLTANGAGAALSADGWLVTRGGTNTNNYSIDAVGYCDHDPGVFKCGDGFE